MCASAAVLARCPLSSWLGNRCFRRQHMADDAHYIPALPTAEVGFLALRFAVGKSVSFFFFLARLLMYLGGQRKRLQRLLNKARKDWLKMGNNFSFQLQARLGKKLAHAKIPPI